MSDVIERSVWIAASRSRVWRALSDPREFGAWFRARFDQAVFVAGASMTGNITYPGYEHLRMALDVERVEPETTLAFRWHPYAIDPECDYSAEEKTLVVFSLEEAEGGTRVTVRESGFDRVPAERRDLAFRMNSGGWEQQVQNIAEYVAAHP